MVRQKVLSQCGGSGMFIPDPGSWFLPIPDPGSRILDPKKATKERGENFFFHTFLCSHKFHKIDNYFSFEVLREKFWVNFQRILEHFTQKVVTKLSKIWLWDPRSGIRKKTIPDPGSRGQKGTGSRIRIRNTVRIPNPYFWEFNDNYLGNKFYNSLKIGPKFFLQHSKTKIM